MGIRLEARRFLVALVLSAASTGVASATPVTFGVGPFSVTCTSSGQLCSPAFPVQVTTSGLLQVSYTASPGHCSDIRVHFLVDGVELAVTPFLAPGATSATFTLSPVSAGTHTLGLQGEGQVGGCNTGSVANWGGTAQVTVDQLAAAVPAPGFLATGLALALGALAWRRARPRR